MLLIGEGANRYIAGQKRQRYSEARGEVGEVAAAPKLLMAYNLVQDVRQRRLPRKDGHGAWRESLSRRSLFRLLVTTLETASAEPMVTAAGG